VDQAVFEAIVDSIIAANAKLMTTTGAVGPPQLTAARDGRVLGMVSLRPVSRGDDAITGIIEMSTFAAAGRATDVVLSWEELDLAVACGADPQTDVLSIDVCWARPHGHVLARFPFQAQIVSNPNPSGVPLIQPIWLTPRVGLHGAALPWVVSQTLDLCWKPLDRSGADHRTAAAYLGSAGYDVSLTDPATEPPRVHRRLGCLSPSMLSGVCFLQ
jgi:hypothetical protein